MNDSAGGNRMSAPSRRRKLFVCPECKETVESLYDPRGHYCPEKYVEGEGRHFVKAEEVEVIPVADVQKVEAERDGWKGLTLKAEGELARLAEETGWVGGQQREGGLPGEIATPVDHALQQFVVVGQELRNHEGFKERLKQFADDLDDSARRPSDLTAAAVRAVKAQGVRDAIAASENPESTEEGGRQ